MLFHHVMQRPSSGGLMLRKKRPLSSVAWQQAFRHPLTTTNVRPFYPSATEPVLYGAKVAVSSFSSLCMEELASRRLIAVLDDPPPTSALQLFPSTTSTLPTTVVNPTRTYVLQARGVTTRQSRGAGVGLVFYDPISKTELWQSRIYVHGYRTTMEAEYTALIMGMDYASQVFGVRRLLVESSYHAIVHQITGNYTTEKPSLCTLLHKVHHVQRTQLDDCTFHHSSSLADKTKLEQLAFRALATRKSSNIVETNEWQIYQRDPMVDRSTPSLSSSSYSSYNPPVFPPDAPAVQSVQIDPTQRYKLQFDGGARNDYGVAGAGMVIYDTAPSTGDNADTDEGNNEEREIWSGWYFHDEDATNNIAEYLALLYGLQCALSMDIRKLLVEGDSLLVVRQMSEEYHTRETSLAVLRNKARQAASALESFEIRHIPRTMNRRADWLAGHAMDKGESYGFDILDGQSDSTSWCRGVPVKTTTRPSLNHQIVSTK